MGNIRTKQVCPECGEKFVHLTTTGKAKGNGFGLVCSNHIHVKPDKFYLDLGRKWDKVYVDSHGQPLTSFKQALEAQKEIDTLTKRRKYGELSACRLRCCGAPTATAMYPGKGRCSLR